MGIARCCFLAMLLCSPLATASAERIKLPDLGDPAESVISIAQEQEIGRQIMLKIKAAHATVDDQVWLDQRFSIYGEVPTWILLGHDGRIAATSHEEPRPSLTTEVEMLMIANNEEAD